MTYTPSSMKNRGPSSKRRPPSSKRRGVLMTNQQAVAAQWTYLCDQMRKSADGLYAMCEQKVDTRATKEVVLLSQNITRDFENLLKYFDEQAKWDTAKATNTKIAVSWEMRKSVSSSMPTDKLPSSPSKVVVDEDGWRVVSSRKRRSHQHRIRDGESVSSATSSSTHSTQPPNNSRRRLLNLHPTSAMDIRQTKSSIAKIAEARRKMWEMQKPKLEERIAQRHKQEGKQKPLKIGINFSDDDLRNVGVSKENKEFKQTRSQGGHRSFDRDGSVSLDSIREEQSTPLPPTTSTDVFDPSTTPVPPLLDSDVVRCLTEEERSLAQEESQLDDLIRSERSESVADDLGEVDEWNNDIDVVESWNCIPNEDFLVNCDWAQMTEDYYASMNNVRAPGEALNKHEKLMSPSRRKQDPEETAAKHVEKLERATAQREAIQASKTARIQELMIRVEEVKARRAQIAAKIQEITIERVAEQQAKARENRRSHLDAVVSKGKDEATKVKEVAFINRMEMKNKDMDVSKRDAVDRRRLEDMSEKKKRASEARLAQTQAVEERRKAAESDRQARILSSAQVTQTRLARAKEIKEQNKLRGKQSPRCSTTLSSASYEIMTSSTHSDTLTDVSEECSASLMSYSTNERSQPSIKECPASTPPSPSKSVASLRGDQQSYGQMLNEAAVKMWPTLASRRRENGETMTCKRCETKFTNDSTTVAHYLLEHSTEQVLPADLRHLDPGFEIVDVIEEMKTAELLTVTPGGEATTSKASNEQSKIEKQRRKFWTQRTHVDEEHLAESIDLKSIKSSIVKQSIDHLTSIVKRLKENTNGKSVNAYAETTAATNLALRQVSPEDVQIAAKFVHRHLQPWTFAASLLADDVAHPEGQQIRVIQSTINLTNSLPLDAWIESGQHVRMVEIFMIVADRLRQCPTADRRWNEVMEECLSLMNRAIEETPKPSDHLSATAIGMNAEFVASITQPTLPASTRITMLSMITVALRLCVTPKSLSNRSHKNGLPTTSGGWATSVLMKTDTLTTLMVEAMTGDEEEVRQTIAQAVMNVFNVVAMLDLRVVGHHLADPRFAYAALTIAKRAVLSCTDHHDVNCLLCTVSVFVGHLIAHGPSSLIGQTLSNAALTASLLDRMSTSITIDIFLCTSNDHRRQSWHSIVPTVLVCLANAQYEPTFVNSHLSPKWLTNYLEQQPDRLKDEEWAMAEHMEYRVDGRTRTKVEQIIKRLLSA